MGARGTVLGCKGPGSIGLVGMTFGIIVSQSCYNHIVGRPI